MLQKKVAIWSENIFGLYSAKPVIEKYVAQGRQVFLIVREQDRETAAKYIGITAVRIKSIESLDSTPRRLLSRFIMPMISPLSFSPMFGRLQSKRRLSWGYILGITIAKFFSPAEINRTYSKVFSRFSGLLPAQFVISFTRVSKPYLLAGKGLKHIAIMESWDHPVKAPWYVMPNYVLTWNRDLRKDVRCYQNVGKVGYVIPLKFRYIAELEKLSEVEMLRRLSLTYSEELSRVHRREFVLYPTSTSSINAVDHPGEMELISDLVAATHEAGLFLYIKPKPNGPIGDYDAFAKMRHVIVGRYSSDISAIDMLRDEYHVFRYLLLQRARVVINVGTTFVLEAALARTPIIQLDLRGGRFGNFSSLSKNVHLQKYLLNLPTVPHAGDTQKLGQAILLKQGQAFGPLLREWLINRPHVHATDR